MPDGVDYSWISRNYLWKKELYLVLFFILNLTFINQYLRAFDYTLCLQVDFCLPKFIGFIYGKSGLIEDVQPWP